MECKNIAEKLINVMTECSRVNKNGVNDYHKYKYATAEDVLEKVNASLTKNKLASVVVPTLDSLADVQTAKGNTEHLATVSVQIHLIDGDSGESVDFYGIGSGQDAGDKAVMKAQTAAIKYAYMLSLCIATGDDPEADPNTDKGTPVAPTKPAPVAKTKAKPATNKPANNIATVLCTDCGADISEKVCDYSSNKYGRPLCYDCQKNYSAA